MPPLIQSLPFGPSIRGRELDLPDSTRRPVRRDAIMLWASLTGLEVDSLPPDTPVFPVLLDTGFNDSVLMTTAQALAWGPRGIERDIFRNGTYLMVAGERVDLYEATVWLWPNVPGDLGRDPTGEPFRLDLANGVALAAPGGKAAREYPLLGLLAVRFADLQITIDGLRERVNIAIP